MFGLPVRHVNVMVIEYWPCQARNLGLLHCFDVATGCRMRLWVRPLLVVAYRRALPVTYEYREAC